MRRYLLVIYILTFSICCSSQTTKFVSVNKTITTPQQEWTLNSIYIKPFYTIFSWTVLCKDMTTSVFLPSSVYLEDADTHIRYGLARQPLLINPSSFNQSVKYELTFKGIPKTVRTVRLVSPAFTIEGIELNSQNKSALTYSQKEIVQTGDPTKDDSCEVSIPLPFTSDIDANIPQVSQDNNTTFALIIANENYQDVEKVSYAKSDGDVFNKYCLNTLGIPETNIKYIADATLNNIRRQLYWLKQVMDAYNGECNVIFYYAGHGIPDEKSGSAYLFPIDGYASDITTGYSLEKLYEDLSSKPAKSVVVLLDACFSGAKRDGGMLVSARGVAIKAKHAAPKGNMVVLSAAQGDETAYPYKEKGHGMFTYYFLKKLQETKGDITFGELADYVISEVKKQSIVVNGKMQTPLASPSSVAIDWRNWKLK